MRAYALIYVHTHLFLLHYICIYNIFHILFLTLILYLEKSLVVGKSTVVDKQCNAAHLPAAGAGARSHGRIAQRLAV